MDTNTLLIIVLVIFLFGVSATMAGVAGSETTPHIESKLSFLPRDQSNRNARHGCTGGRFCFGFDLSGSFGTLLH